MPVLDPLPDYDITSEHCDDPEDAISDDGEIIEDGVEDDGVAAAASILRLFAHELFGWSCSYSSSHGVKGVCIKLVSLSSEVHPDSTDDHAER